jgi:hypothetical protein
MFLGGRGAGKTTIEGVESYQDMATMPRGRAFLASSTYAQILNITLPGIERKWQEMGLEENEDYVIGVKPPAFFDKSLDEPRKYQNVISFANGYRIIMMSMDRPDLNRGGSFVAGALDEAALVRQEHVTRVLIPSIRGYDKEYRHRRRGVFRAYTSIPWKPSGYWTLDYEEKAKADPANYHFVEACALDNIAALGADYITRLEAEMPYLEFLVEVMNQRIRKVADAFYHAFDPEKHTYTVRYLYDENQRGISTTGILDKNYNQNELLEASFDFSGYFNCATIFQGGKMRDSTGTAHNVEHLLRQFYVKTEDGKVAELVDKIVAQYDTHANKLIRLWGEPRGHDPKPDTPKTLFQQIADRFRLSGWRVEIKVQAGQVRSHKERCEWMNEMLKENSAQYPRLRINDQTAKDVIIAMQVTGTKEDGSKDKAKEKDRLFPQEHAPHFTDTVDYYFTQKHYSTRSRNRRALSAGA